MSGGGKYLSYCDTLISTGDFVSRTRCRRRRIRRRVPRQIKSTRFAFGGSRRGHQDPETGKFGQSPQRFSHGSVHHGPIRTPQRDILARGRHPVQPRHDHHRVHGERFIGHVFKSKYFRFFFYYNNIVVVDTPRTPQTHLVTTAIKRYAISRSF